MSERSSVYDSACRDHAGDDDIHDVACAIIRAFGANTPSILRMRVANHRHGSTSDAAYWHDVATVVETTLTGHRGIDGAMPLDQRFHVSPV